MAKFDYYVSAVSYNKDSTHIAKLRIHPIDAEGGWKLTGEEVTRPHVVSLIEKKKTFASITQGKDKKWYTGAQLEVIQVATDYLKTVKDTSAKDNLENLPQF
ncbi:DUF3892 domain-containing protein [Acidovorax sp. A1169]|uniref:DUF3892 domain-containing protein n=1 Tax=Acidovorax sp. A1169 TaxID=3059524 RepID=UPI002737C4B3|nr:DUF3892 domain-containing protein [Acidovorax sp. A1169]MDP4074187.1 DUF3892 domain-containing protein [Acidovorax sp. A1169]